MIDVAAYRRRWQAARRTVRSRVPEPAARLIGWLRSDEFLTTSASLGFYALTSLPPMVLIALWTAGAVVQDETLQNLGAEVEGRSPDQLPVGDVLRGLIDLATEVGFLSVLAALWPASAYGAALARAFTRVAPEPPSKIGGMRGRLLALGVIALLPFLVFGALAALYFVPRLVGAQGWVVTAALALGSFLGLALVVAVVFTLFDVRDTTPGDVVLGAVLTTAMVAGITAGYLVYLQFADFTDRYGATGLATLVLLALWLMLTNGMLLVGYRLMLRRALRRQRSRGTTPASPHREPRTARPEGSPREGPGSQGPPRSPGQTGSRAG